MMIVDDRKLIIGSANINDRSQIGTHDSELACCIEGPLDLQVDSGFGVYSVSSAINKFRRSLTCEHFGVDFEFLTSIQVWRAMRNIIDTNTWVYSKVFDCYPSDDFANRHDLKRRRHSVSLSDFKAYSGMIRGQAVVYPYGFLREEHLDLSRHSEISTLLIPIHVIY